MAERISQAIILLILLFLAASNWHTYIRKKQYERDGWLCLMAAMAGTIASFYVWFH